MKSGALQLMRDILTGALTFDPLHFVPLTLALPKSLEVLRCNFLFLNFVCY